MLCIGRNVVDAAVKRRGRVFGEEWESDIAHVDVQVAPSSISLLPLEHWHVSANSMELQAAQMEEGAYALLRSTNMRRHMYGE